MSNLGSLTPQNIEDVLERLLEDLETTKEGMLWWKRLFEGKIPLHKQDEDFESRRFESRFSVEPNGRIFIEGKGQLTGALRKFLGAEDYIHAAAELLSSLNEKLSTDKSLNVRKDRNYMIRDGYKFLMTAHALPDGPYAQPGCSSDCRNRGREWARCGFGRFWV